MDRPDDEIGQHGEEPQHCHQEYRADRQRIQRRPPGESANGLPGFLENDFPPRLRAGRPVGAVIPASDPGLHTGRVGFDFKRDTVCARYDPNHVVQVDGFLVRAGDPLFHEVVEKGVRQGENHAPMPFFIQTAPIFRIARAGEVSHLGRECLVRRRALAGSLALGLGGPGRGGHVLSRALPVGSDELVQFLQGQVHAGDPEEFTLFIADRPRDADDPLRRSALVEIRLGYERSAAVLQLPRPAVPLAL